MSLRPPRWWPRPAGVLPDLGGQADHGGLVGGEADVGQRELVGPDPVARLVVEERVHLADLDRHAEAAQLVLVALEHLLERVGRGVRVEDLRIRSLAT